MSAQITLVYNKANPFGIKQDADIIESMVTQFNRNVGIEFAKVKHADLLEPPYPTDICIHLEIPSTAWMPFAHKNVIMVNSEWWVSAWDCLLPKFDLVLTKIKGTDISGATFVPWRASIDEGAFKKYPASTELSTGCLWMLGGSKNKRDFARQLLPLWKEDFPKLVVYTTSSLDLSGNLAGNVEVIVKDLDEENRRQLQRYYPVHLCASRSEGFGLAAAEGEAAGAYLILNTIPAYKTAFGEREEGVGWIHTSLTESEVYTKAKFADISGHKQEVQESLGNLFTRLQATDLKSLREEQQLSSRQRALDFRQTMTPLLRKLADDVAVIKRGLKGNRHLPAPLDGSECPPISVVTLTHNRRKFIDLAFHNIVLTDYPKDKIEWIIVDDSDKPEESVSDKIAQFAKRAPVAQVVYVPLPKKRMIGTKRNIGIERASNDIILFMDDDDHYPETSFRRRVAWLTKHPWKPQAIGCCTIACYDLVKGLSAVNTPPWDLGPAQRVSEATLTFYKSFWEQQKFPLTNTSEGEGFLKGRESAFLEIPPQQILVAFSHQGNSSGRRIPAPADAKPGCFWGFPKEFLIWIHKLAGIEVEEEKEPERKRQKH